MNRRNNKKKKKQKLKLNEQRKNEQEIHEKKNSCKKILTAAVVCIVALNTRNGKYFLFASRIHAHHTIFSLFVRILFIFFNNFFSIRC